MPGFKKETDYYIIVLVFWGVRCCVFVLTLPSVLQGHWREPQPVQLMANQLFKKLAVASLQCQITLHVMGCANTSATSQFFFPFSIPLCDRLWAHFVKFHCKKAFSVFVMKKGHKPVCCCLGQLFFLKQISGVIQTKEKIINKKTMSSLCLLIALRFLGSSLIPCGRCMMPTLQPEIRSPTAFSLME